MFSDSCEGIIDEVNTILLNNSMSKRVNFEIWIMNILFWNSLILCFIVFGYFEYIACIQFCNFFCKQLSRSSRPKFCDIVRQKELHHRDEEDKSESSEYSYYRQQGHLLTRWRKHSNARCVVVFHLIHYKLKVLNFTI